MSSPEVRPLQPLGRGTLGRQLVVRVILLVVVVAVALSSLTTLATNQVLTRSVDRQLDAAFSRQVRNPHDDDRYERPIELPPGQPVGTIVVQNRAGRVSGAILTDDTTGVAPITVDAAQELLAVPTTREQVSLTVPGYGHYRATAVERSDGVYVVSLPLHDIDRTLQELIILELLLTMAAIGAAILAVRRLVVKSLEPLNRLASTAQQVSTLELSKGEVALPVRVAPADADPTNEVGQVGLALNHMLSNVEGALASRQASETKVRQFVADASHELRNPLAAIRGYAELTRRHRDDLPPDAAFALGRVESESARMSSLVEDLLLLARMDSNPNLTIREVDLTELVMNAVADARAADPAYDWRLAVGPEPVMAKADRQRLHQVVANLLANARKHTPEGTTVTTGVRIEGDHALITVTDNGPGINPEIKDKVFERFTRADSARTRSGRAKDSTGLGLAIVQAVMEAHHGSARVDSEPGRTEFTLRLPR